MEVVRVCNWYHPVRPIIPGVELGDPDNHTHGICPSCKEQMAVGKRLKEVEVIGRGIRKLFSCPSDLLKNHYKELGLLNNEILH
jgi:hypothetical protein